jgi:hypothetical protein
LHYSLYCWSCLILKYPLTPTFTDKPTELKTCNILMHLKHSFNLHHPCAELHQRHVHGPGGWALHFSILIP